MDSNQQLEINRAIIARERRDEIAVRIMAGFASNSWYTNSNPKDTAKLAVRWAEVLISELDEPQ